MFQEPHIQVFSLTFTDFRIRRDSNCGYFHIYQWRSQHTYSILLRLFTKGTTTLCWFHNNARERLISGHMVRFLGTEFFNFPCSVDRFALITLQLLDYSLHQPIHYIFYLILPSPIIYNLFLFTYSYFHFQNSQFLTYFHIYILILLCIYIFIYSMLV